MNKEKVLCVDCGELIDITPYVDNYWETDQEDPVVIIECKKCSTKNTIYWQSDVVFGCYRATDEDEQFAETINK